MPFFPTRRHIASLDGCGATPAKWVFEPFDGTIGDSDMHGSAGYRTGGARRSLQANLTSKLLDLDDLGPVIGVPPKTGPGETASPEQQRKAAEAQAKTRVLPAQRFPTEQWGEMDAEVRLSAKRVLRPFIETGPGEDSDCGRLIAQARAKGAVKKTP